MSLIYLTKRHVASLRNAVDATCRRSRNAHLELANAYGALIIVEMAHGPRASAA